MSLVLISKLSSHHEVCLYYYEHGCMYSKKKAWPVKCSSLELNCLCGCFLQSLYLTLPACPDFTTILIITLMTMMMIMMTMPTTLLMIMMLRKEYVDSNYYFNWKETTAVHQKKKKILNKPRNLKKKKKTFKVYCLFRRYLSVRFLEYCLIGFLTSLA